MSLLFQKSNNMENKYKNLIRLIAFYLPQFHTIPENDEWWGKGFTEWTNVVKAKPLFKGHYQPHLPADLGFYDLRVPEVREAQAELARNAGIEGFCYWHYWFAGRRLLERPFNEVLASGKPDFPFCLAWANESWTGIWHGAPERVLIKQTYPGVEDYQAHFNAVKAALLDPRYICVEGKPLFIIYRPLQIPNPHELIDTWQKLAVKNGLKGIFFLAMGQPNWDYHQAGYDGFIIDNFYHAVTRISQKKVNLWSRLFKKVLKKDYFECKRKVLHLPKIIDYKEFVSTGLAEINLDQNQFPSVFPNWDNTPRSKTNGYVLHQSTPELFTNHLIAAINQVNDYLPDKRLIFLKSWNEWAEGNYIEPDQEYGLQYLKVVKDALTEQE